MKRKFIQDNKEHYSLSEMFEALEVSSSGYYQSRARKPSKREIEDEGLKEEILKISELAKGRYGYRPIHEHLKDEDINCGRDRTLRLMGQLGISGSQAPRYKPQGTDSNHDYGYSSNMLKGRNKPERCDEVWVADTTYLRVEGKWMYLATVMDLCSRRIVGWSISENNDADLVCQALKNAHKNRGTLREGVIHHSDRGSTYASGPYRDLLAKLRMRSSMSAKGNCYDNAAMESFYGRFKKSTIGNRVFKDGNELKVTVFEYIEMFYNNYRKHSSLGYQSPLAFEQKKFPHGGCCQRQLA
jgi:putative transposase